MSCPDDLLYTKQHEWIRIEESTGRMGISDHAQEQLGDVTFIELPDVGKEVKQFDPLCTIESVKAVSDIYAPMSGRISQVNKELDENPQYVNESPYERGWIVELELTDTSEKDELMDAAAYQAYVEESAE